MSISVSLDILKLPALFPQIKCFAIAQCLYSSIHSKITMAGNAVPYCTVTALVPTQKYQCCSFETASLLPWSTQAGTSTEKLCRYSMVTAEVPQKSSTVTTV